MANFSLTAAEWLTTHLNGYYIGRLKVTRIPIRAKITLPYLFLSGALAIGAVYVVTQIIFDTIEERFTNQLIESGKLASEWMVREEEELLETLRLLSHAEGVAESIKREDAEILRQLTFGITLDHQEDAVEILDASGGYLLSMHHRQGGNLEEYEFSKFGDAPINEWPPVKNILNQQADQIGDKYAGFIPADWGDHFYVTGPVFDHDGHLSGIVMVGKKMSTLVRQIREETLAQVTVYSFEGQVIASTFVDPQPLQSTEANSIIDRQADSSLRRNMGVQRGLNINNIDYDEILGPWEIRGDIDLGIIGVAMPKTFLVSASNVTRIQIAILVSFALVLVILVGVNLATTITRPLLSLVQASSKVAEGDLNVQVDSRTNDEISVLANSFNQMVASLYRSKMDLVQAYDSTLEGWSKALELRDKETEGHTQRVTEMTLRLAHAFGISGEDIANVRRGALLHDIGKMGIPDDILLKEGPLSEDEWEIMRKHPQYAYDMLKEINYLHPALDIPYYHHERWDGSGYPLGLKGEEIPLAARIFAIVDVWDALSSNRPYRMALPPDEVSLIIKDGSGTHFDPLVVDKFFEVVSAD
jgi:putative nucleotidyltransferase with HDIG domain